MAAKKLLIIDRGTDVYVGVIAVNFTSLGIWLALRLSKPKNKIVFVEKERIVSTPATNPFQ